MGTLGLCSIFLLTLIAVFSGSFIFELCVLPWIHTWEGPAGNTTTTMSTTTVVAGSTTLTASAVAGATQLQVASIAGFAVGDDVQIADAFHSETNTIQGFGSIILQSPTQHSYAAGATVTKQNKQISTATNKQQEGSNKQEEEEKKPLRLRYQH